MQKLIAFDLYTRKPTGAHHPVLRTKDGRAVYYASEVDELLTRVRDAIHGDERSVLDELNSILMDPGVGK